MEVESKVCSFGLAVRYRWALEVGLRRADVEFRYEGDIAELSLACWRGPRSLRHRKGLVFGPGNLGEEKRVGIEVLVRMSVFPLIKAVQCQRTSWRRITEARGILSRHSLRRVCAGT